METRKQFKDAINSKLSGALEKGDIYKYNEINANVMLGSLLFITVLMCLLCVGLNEVGLFTANKNMMRMVGLDVVLVEVIIMIINKKTHGEPSWMKGLIIAGQLFAFGLMAAVLGHNVTLGMAVPVVLSIRYCDGKFTQRVSFYTIAVFLLAAFGNMRFGIKNLNIYPFEPGTTITIIKTLRQAVTDAGLIEAKTYIINYLRSDFLPRYIIFVLISFAATTIARRGMEMCKTQDDVSQKTSRIETELNLATEIQAGMLPCIFPAFPEHGEIQLFAENLPAKEVGGDFYDYFVIDDDHVAFVMADVSGKGVGAALFMTISKIVLKNQLLITKSPAEAMRNTNNQLCENNVAGLFVTCWAGIYEISTGTLTYTNAGHNPPVVHHKGQKCYYLKGKNGLVLAAMDGMKYTESTIHIDKGDELFLYTDGVTEATNTKNQLFGEDRLIRSLERLNVLSCREQVMAVQYDLENFEKGKEQFDDITMMAIKFVEDKQI